MPRAQRATQGKANERSPTGTDGYSGSHQPMSAAEGRDVVMPPLFDRSGPHSKEKYSLHLMSLDSPWTQGCGVALPATLERPGRARTWTLDMGPSCRVHVPQCHQQFHSSTFHPQNPHVDWVLGWPSLGCEICRRSARNAQQTLPHGWVLGAALWMAELSLRHSRSKA